MLRTSEAARALGLHTLDFVARLHGMVGSWSECWPEVDDGYVETLRILLDRPRAKRVQDPGSPPAQPAARGDDPCPHSIGDHAARLIEKMWRKGRWGDMRVSHDTIHVHMMRDIDDSEEVLDDLVRRGILMAEGRRGSFALNPGRKTEIDAIAQWSCDHPDA